MADRGEQIGTSPAGRPLPSIQEILEDPAASCWLKHALRSALLLDPVDAANDAEVLSLVLAQHCRSMLDQDLSKF